MLLQSTDHNMDSGSWPSHQILLSLLPISASASLLLPLQDFMESYDDSLSIAQGEKFTASTLYSRCLVRQELD